MQSIPPLESRSQINFWISKAAALGFICLNGIYKMFKSSKIWFIASSTRHHNFVYNLTLTRLVLWSFLVYTNNGARSIMPYYGNTYIRAVFGALFHRYQARVVITLFISPGLLLFGDDKCCKIIFWLIRILWVRPRHGDCGCRGGPTVYRVVDELTNNFNNTVSTYI